MRCFVIVAYKANALYKNIIFKGNIHFVNAKEMFHKKLKIAGVVALAVFIAATGCNKNAVHEKFDAPATAGLPAKPHSHVPVNANSIITVSLLDSNHVWEIDGVSYVAPGSTLTIQPGTFLTSGTPKTYNDPVFGPQTLKGVLVVTRGGKLIANGTAAKPIVFTSPNATNRKAGDFGGVVLLGNAPINQPIPQRIEGIPDPVPATVDVNYGGAVANDNSGSLSFVRIEFAGFRLTANNEINGLTCGGVGTGTTLNHIQVSWSADDAYEFFGGTVNANHLIALSSDDDDYDFDFGYSGTIQYAISLKDSSSTHSKSGSLPDANGIESDNDGTGSAASPKTKPILRNFTFVGIRTLAVQDTSLKYGNRFRRATSLDLQQSIIVGYDTAAAFENVTCPSTFNNNAYTGVLFFNPSPWPCAAMTGNTAAASHTSIFTGDPFYHIGSPYSLSNIATVAAHATKGAIAAGSSWGSGWFQFQPKTY